MNLRRAGNRYMAAGFERDAVTPRDPEDWRPPKLAIYLAGKIVDDYAEERAASPHIGYPDSEYVGWRYSVVDGLKQEEERIVESGDFWDPKKKWRTLRDSVFAHWDYVGPYAMRGEMGSASHGMEENVHGMMIDGGMLPVRRSHVADYCLDAIGRCDLLFAWLGPQRSPGTLIELGYAKALSKPIIIATDEIRDNDWFAHEMASPRMPPGIIVAEGPVQALRRIYHSLDKARQIEQFWESIDHNVKMKGEG